MPTIPAVTLGTGVDIDTVYDGNGTGGLFKPRVSPDTAEILNGGLDQANYSGGTNSIPAEAFQSGCFARGLYTGFDRFEFQYIRQLDGDGATPGSTFSGTDEQRVIHAGLSQQVFIPWPALVFYGYQAFFQHDATKWENNGGTPNVEFWDVRVRVLDEVKQGLLQKLPFNRISSDTPTTGNMPPEASEHRFKFPTKFSFHTMDKGYFRLQTSVWGRVFEPDRAQAKLKTPTGGVWIVAIRNESGGD
tara:strand:+ start:578 stop:1315 length:738 start_codon:yes stop_codon:yes gene_type:complete